MEWKTLMDQKEQNKAIKKKIFHLVNLNVLNAWDHK